MLLGWAIPLMFENPPPWAPPLAFAVGLACLVAWVALGFWALRPGRRSRPRDLIAPYYVCSYMANQSAWGLETQKTYDRAGGGMTAMLGAFWEFQSKAQLPGTPIRAYGMKNGQGEPVEIPHTFWIANGFDVEATLEGRKLTAPYPGRGNVAHAAGPQVRYTGVMVERAGVEAVWPRPSLIRRILSRLRKDA